MGIMAYSTAVVSINGDEKLRNIRNDLRQINLSGQLANGHELSQDTIDVLFKMWNDLGR